MNVTNNQLFFVVASVLFVVVSVVFNIFLLFGAGFGAVGLYFFLKWYIPYQSEAKKRKLNKALEEVERLKVEVFGKKKEENEYY